MIINFRSGWTLGFGLVAAAVVANAGLSYWNIRTLAATDRWVVHTLEVLAEQNDTLSLLKDAETGQRGYLLTGRGQYLEPYRDATARISGKLNHLKELTADNPRQQERFPDLEARVADKLSELELAIDLRKRMRLEDALDVVRADNGKRVMDEIRGTMAAMEAEERRSLQEQTADAEARVRTTTVRICVACGLVLVYQFVRHVLAERRRRATQGDPGNMAKGSQSCARGNRQGHSARSAIHDPTVPSTLVRFGRFWTN
jgi:CHASE3 domain sensor protein